MRTSLSAQCRRQKSSKRGREGTETACIPVYRGTTDAAEFKLRREDDCDLDVADEELQRNVIQFTTRSCAAMNVGSYLRTNVMKRSGNGFGVGGAVTHSVRNVEMSIWMMMRAKLIIIIYGTGYYAHVYIYTS